MEKKEYNYLINCECDIEVKAKNKKEALKLAEEKLKKSEVFKEIFSYIINSDLRTKAQNRSLHLLFKQISEKCVEKGIEMRQIVKDEFPIESTPENIKWLWKILQQHLFKKKSTTELKKTGDIEIVYDNFNKILIERTKGEISLPPFPSIKNDYILKHGKNKKNN